MVDWPRRSCPEVFVLIVIRDVSLIIGLRADQVVRLPPSTKAESNLAGSFGLGHAATRSRSVASGRVTYLAKFDVTCSSLRSGPNIT